MYKNDRPQRGDEHFTIIPLIVACVITSALVLGVNCLRKAPCGDVQKYAPAPAMEEFHGRR